jgi:DNA-directed RNA polymerase sigma subunit (sigma70/sigma32)
MKETKLEYPYNLLEGMLNIYHSDSKFNEMILLNYKDIVANIDNNWDYVLDTLTPREAVFITLHYKEGKTYKEIAKEHGVTIERIRQIINKGLRSLLHPSRIRLIAIPKEKLNEYKTFNDQIDEEIAKLKREFHRIKTDGVNYITNITKAIDIEELDFSTRTYNALKRAKINTLDDLISHTVEELSRIRNLGRKSLKEICMKLYEIGYSLKDDSYDNDSLYDFINDDDNDE